MSGKETLKEMNEIGVSSLPLGRRAPKLVKKLETRVMRSS